MNQQLFDLTGKDSTIFLHCLPAFHDTNTLYGQEIYEKYGLAEWKLQTKSLEVNIQKCLIKLKIECIQLRQ